MFYTWQAHSDTYAVYMLINMFWTVIFFFLHKLVFIILSVMDITSFYVCGMNVGKNKYVNENPHFIKIF